MEDLQALNKRILTQMGAANVNLHSALSLLAVCVGKLKLSAEEISTTLAGLSTNHHENSLDVTSINKEYLSYARQTARDIINGIDGLIVLISISLKPGSCPPEQSADSRPSRR
jgi:hypothetical protein